ncbi:MAG: hypothetical protein HY660_07290 [Armatimonadetes bacterium]|nr:hypothetical protein [Armatimonadota bacterium]
MRPIVGGLERRLAGRIEVRRVNVLSLEGRALVEEHRVEIVPLLIAVDARGREVLREYGVVAAAAVERAVGAAPGR